LRVKLYVFPVIAVLALILVRPAVGRATCSADFFNPITYIYWDCIFPVAIGGITIFGSDIDSPGDDISSPICICGTTIGLSASFWEPARIIETVKDPWCFNLIGADLGGNGFLAGDSQRTTKASKSTFAQAHYYMLNVWSLLDLFLDLPCLENTGFDIGYITEVDPLWNDDLLAFLLNPEALLFGNPVLQFSCIADSVAANAGLPLDVLFWCMGSWGSAYPLTGHKGNDNIVEDNAALAGRLIYKLVREYTLTDTATNVCGPTMWPIWTKSHYRLQIMRPVRDYTCQPIGRSGLIWAAGKNPPYSAGGNAADNFDWVLTRKKLCCLGYSL